MNEHIGLEVFTPRAILFLWFEAISARLSILVSPLKTVIIPK